MPTVDYRYCGTGLLRASSQRLAPSRWPVLSHELDCRAWLDEVWPRVAAAVTHASPVLASGVLEILRGRRRSAREVRRTTEALLRYVLRFGRSTPFGLFAGVAPVTIGDDTEVRVGDRHRAVARPDSRWLRQVIQRLEACPQLLARLKVVFHDAVEECGDRLALAEAEVVSIRNTPAVASVRRLAATPVHFQVLVEALVAEYPGAGDPTAMLLSLVERRFLVTSLRAPGAVSDPLGYLADSLQALDFDEVPVAAFAAEVIEIRRTLDILNQEPHEQARAQLAERMHALVPAPRGPLSLDLRLDADVRLPHRVVREIEHTAGVLARLVREHTGSRAFRDYFTAFCDRYGTGTLVPVRAVVDSAAGLGWPRDYPSSPAASGRHVFSERDRLLLSWITEAIAQGEREIELDEAAVDALAAAGGDPDAVPPHIDLGARIHAVSVADLERGEYRFTVAPGRAAGTLSARLSILVPEAGLAAVFSSLPSTTEGAIVTQMSFTPPYPSAENVARLPRYTPDVVSVGEYRPDHEGVIGVDDLAVTASRRRLHLVSLSRRRVIEPMVLHALAVKQQPPLARLLGELSRALDTGWIGFDWGPTAAELPFRPRLRYRRAILSPARWRLAREALPGDPAGWDDALARWRATWRCPHRVELRDFDQQLPLDLTVPAHREVVYHHLHQHDEAVLVEAPQPDADGWLDGRSHLVVLPLVSRRAPEPSPPVEFLPVLGSAHGHPPASPRSAWLYAKLYLAEYRMDPLLVHHLPDLLADLGERDWWFVRYPQAREGDEPDHLRLRVRTTGDADKILTAVTAWADRLRTDGLLSRWAFDTYYPEIGRYRAIAEAEAVFATDSRYVLARLTGPAADRPSPVAATGLSLFDLATAFLGGQQRAADWLARQAPPAVPDRADVAHVTHLVRTRAWPDVVEPAEVGAALHARAEAVHRYRHALPADADLDGCLHALLHMHHNRALGVNRDREAVCLRLARQAAATWRTTFGGQS
ncbi:lantibiotic dehydratase [Amycolatopsis pithecellobii]|uniref:Lantibiotic dehydratase n=1 Tax=Amycolatopsis pithecellobii TaxID=664692 RepID=A0A6N7Z5W5_9PSEU|nr:lantibiotic dehydratase [Amycolatopsis pithecellobii]MTD57149.1 lantibiotic dehydratase [Amycolatopsis pithecellobii]